MDKNTKAWEEIASFSFQFITINYHLHDSCQNTKINLRRKIRYMDFKVEKPQMHIYGILSTSRQEHKRHQIQSSKYIVKMTLVTSELIKYQNLLNQK